MPSETSPAPVASQPPLLLKLVCAIAMVFYASHVYPFATAVVQPESYPLPRWFAAGGLLDCVLGIAMLLGIWKMRRWAVLGFVLVTAGHNALLWAGHQWNLVPGLAVQSVVTLVALSTLHRMR